MVSNRTQQPPPAVSLVDAGTCFRACAGPVLVPGPLLVKHASPLNYTLRSTLDGWLDAGLSNQERGSSSLPIHRIVHPFNLPALESALQKTSETWVGGLLLNAEGRWCRISYLFFQEPHTPTSISLSLLPTTPEW